MKTSLKKFAIRNGGGIIGAKEVGNANGKVVEIDAAGDKTDDRHDNVVDKGIDDGVESATNGYTNGEIDDRTAIDELDEFFANIIGFFADTTEKVVYFLAFRNMSLNAFRVGDIGFG